MEQMKIKIKNNWYGKNIKLKGTLYTPAGNGGGRADNREGVYDLDVRSDMGSL